MSVFENDWIMRQIEGMTDMLGKVLLHREKSEIRVEEELSDEDVKKYHRRIQALLRERKYPEAVQYLREFLRPAVWNISRLHYLRLIS